MAYIPSEKDFEDSGYQPTLNDFLDNAPNQVLGNIHRENQQPRQRLPAEEFTNPGMYPGFNQLPKEERLQRLALSAFDPGNMSALGRMEYPGTYEDPNVRMAASLVPTFLNPAFTAGGRFGAPILNALARIGTGTASNIAYQAPNINSLEDLKNVGRSSLTGNALLEAATLPFRGAATLAETYHPVKYTSSLSKKIANESAAAEAMTNKLYSPVNMKYDNHLTTLTPEKYLKDAGIIRENLYPDAKLIHDRFIKDPSFKNLHDLQSKLGKDWARISKSPASEEKAQLFNQYRTSLQDRIKSFLSNDKEALGQYQMASDFAKTTHYPYLATPTLKKIAKGKLDVDPKLLSKSIQRGIEKTVGKEERSLIPEEHPLRNHLRDLNARINLGNAAKVAIPAISGGLLGEVLHPGLGGILGGAGSALGSSALGGIARKYGSPSLTDFIQNPSVQNVFNRLSPLYYGAGRLGIGEYSGNK